jgi:hypothetical protein
MEGFACTRNRRSGEDGADIAYGSARIRDHLLLSETGTVGRRVGLIGVGRRAHAVDGTRRQRTITQRGRRTGAALMEGLGMADWSGLSLKQQRGRRTGAERMAGSARRGHREREC